MPTETQIVRAICEKLRPIPNSRVYKNHGSAFTHRGRPDIEFFYKGHALFLEVKCPGARCSRAQTVEMKRLNDAGAIVEVVDSVDEAMRCVGAFVQTCNYVMKVFRWHMEERNAAN